MRKIDKSWCLKYITVWSPEIVLGWIFLLICTLLCFSDDYRYAPMFYLYGVFMLSRRKQRALKEEITCTIIDDELVISYADVRLDGLIVVVKSVSINALMLEDIKKFKNRFIILYGAGTLTKSTCFYKTPKQSHRSMVDGNIFVVPYEDEIAKALEEFLNERRLSNVN